MTGLTDALGDHGDRVASLETRVEDLELGGGGGGSGASGKTVWWSDVAPTQGNDPDILLRSPFGYNPANPNADVNGIYYDPAGVSPGEAVWPYLTPNGHLKFIARNESASADPVLATQSALDATNTMVDTKAARPT